LFKLVQTLRDLRFSIEVSPNTVFSGVIPDCPSIEAPQFFETSENYWPKDTA